MNKARILARGKVFPTFIFRTKKNRFPKKTPPVTYNGEKVLQI